MGSQGSRNVSDKNQRLLAIVQHMRRNKLVRAEDLAAAYGVSERTIYRDIRDLVASGVPITGEAGVGYVMRPGYDLPPLMFSEAEIEALVLGARIVESWADKELAAAAGDVIAKVETVLPERLRSYMENIALVAPKQHYMQPIDVDLADIRSAIRKHRKIQFAYTDGVGDESERIVRPLSLAYFGPVWILAAWCELRQDFRTFRLDRIRNFKLTSQTFRPEAGRTLNDFLKRPETWNRGRAPRAARQ
jgi:predicted DNA-binding transcriptional regulator YafY